MSSGLQEAGLSEVADVAAGSYSGGMQRRVSVVCALVGWGDVCGCGMQDGPENGLRAPGGGRSLVSLHACVLMGAWAVRPARPNVIQVGSPHVLYLDEPSTGLDPASRRLLWKVGCPGRVWEVWEEGREIGDIMRYINRESQGHWMRTGVGGWGWGAGQPSTGRCATHVRQFRPSLQNPPTKVQYHPFLLGWAPAVVWLPCWP